MTLRHLKIFKEVCDHGSITKAAEALFIAQPSVSVAISELEKHYNVTLFQRISNRLIITEEGKSVYERACNVLNAFDDFESTAYNGDIPKIKIGTSLTVGTYILPDLMCQIKKLFPQVQVSVKIFQTKIIEDLVAKGELDIGLIESSTSLPVLQAEKFSEDELVVVCSQNFPAPDNISKNEIASYPFILREQGSASRDLFDMYLKQNDIHFTPSVETVIPQAAIELAKLGLGIAVLPFGMVKELISSKVLKRINLEGAKFQRTYFIIAHRQRNLSTLQKQIYDLCLNYKNFSEQ